MLAICYISQVSVVSVKLLYHHRYPSIAISTNQGMHTWLVGKASILKVLKEFGEFLKYKLSHAHMHCKITVIQIQGNKCFSTWLGHSYKYQDFHSNITKLLTSTWTCAHCTSWQYAPPIDHESFCVVQRLYIGNNILSTNFIYPTFEEEVSH